MYLNPDSFKTAVIEFLLNHASLGDLLYQCMTVGELLFLVALCTTKFDKYLAYFAISFHTISIFLVNVYFFEFTLLLLPFLIRPHFNSKEFLLSSLWKNSKPLFSIIVIFLVVHTFYFTKMYHLVQKEDYKDVYFFGAYPIQNYMMYSYPYQAESFDDYEIKINDELVNSYSWLPIKTEQFEGNIIVYEKLLTSNAILSHDLKVKTKYPKIFKNTKVDVDLEEYKDWIIRKTAGLTNSLPEEISIYHCSYEFEGAKVKLKFKRRVL